MKIKITLFVLLLICFVAVFTITIKKNDQERSQTFNSLEKDAADFKKTVTKLNKTLDNIEQDTQALEQNRRLFLKKLEEEMKKSEINKISPFYYSYFSFYSYFSYLLHKK